ncbi:hypothetical protein [Pelagibaculum spongiae]|uniref:DUF4124 domain-containing protein n=1 Tax=Pelagibaculum spongiae TaxID=2080658 RepID=A0A2V1GVE3_9GAMM|nr:hypothetical protein [Pelagibaculum spongiae]PVZ68311.1 hypothetical protein DC094_13575 [Pelagibaculum spongiae]
MTKINKKTGFGFSLIRQALLVGLAGLLLAQPASAERKRFYRYIDEGGRTVINYTIPPKYAAKGYEIINENGMVLKKIAAALTRQEYKAQQDAKRQAKLLQAKATKKKAEQSRLDAILTSTYTSVQDILYSMLKKLGNLETQINVTQGNIGRLNDQATDFLTNAANLERAGKAIPASLTRNIHDTRRQIAESQSFIEKKKAEKSQIRSRHMEDIVRFQQIREREPHRFIRYPSQRVSCFSPNQCQKLWQKAVRFVEQKATEPLEVQQDGLLITRQPNQSESVSMMLTQVSQKQETWIVMEAHCKASIVGERLCSSDSVKILPAIFQDRLSAN